jgi:hypothetical protein
MKRPAVKRSLGADPLVDRCDLKRVDAGFSDKALAPPASRFAKMTDEFRLLHDPKQLGRRLSCFDISHRFGKRPGST